MGERGRAWESVGERGRAWESVGERERAPNLFHRALNFPTERSKRGPKSKSGVSGTLRIVHEGRGGQRRSWESVEERGRAWKSVEERGRA